MMKKFLRRLSCVCLLVAVPVSVHALETDWMPIEKGSADKESGAVIRDVKVDAAKNGATSITVAIPKSAAADSLKIEEVVVYGKRKSKGKQPLQDVHYEWASDYEHDYYGLIVTFGKKPNMPIRFYFKNPETSDPNH